MKVAKEGYDFCEHSWVDRSYNDWGFPMYVAECKFCGRNVFSASEDVFETVMKEEYKDVII